MQRATAARALEEVGYAVLTAEDAESALRLLEVRGHEVVALFAPVHLFGSMNGIELAQTVHVRWPHIRPFLRDADIAHRDTTNKADSE